MKMLRHYFAFVLIVTTFCGVIGHKTTENNLKNKDPNWWKTATFYQVYPRSFKDENNDGIGDLKGIINKLDHLADAGVQAIWLSPIYKSPMVDGGYDISDYRDIDPDYGTLDDFSKLVVEAKKQGLKVIMDFVPNHTSDDHEWFAKSAAKEPGYEDYFIWADGKEENSTKLPPNNWLSVFGNSAWTWNDVRKQYFLHQFTDRQPDLNFRNEKVILEMQDILTFWMDRGVDGFRTDAVPHLVEDKDLKDEPINEGSGLPANNYNYLNHIYTKDQPEAFKLVYQWREHLDNYTARVGGDTRVLMTEAATNIENVAMYYGTEDGSRLGAHFSFNFYFVSVNKDTRPRDVKNTIDDWNKHLPAIYTKNWLIGNHDNPRVASRTGPEKVDGFNMLVSFLPGIAITYMGEEIAQENGEVTCEEGRDPSAISNCTTFPQVSRDFERTPFQWDDTTNAGFNTGAKPWLPVGKEYKKNNLAEQISDNRSHYNIYKRLIGLREDFAKYEKLNASTSSEDENVLLITRWTHKNSDFHSFIFNMGTETTTVDLTANFEMKSFEVVLSSRNCANKIGAVLDGNNATNLELQPGDSVIFVPFRRITP